MRSVLLPAIALAATVTAAAAPPAPDVFSGTSVIELTLEAPFTELFARAESQEDFAVIGRLTLDDGTSGPQVFERVSIAERGHTSRRASECDFPKLKLSVAGAAPASSALAGMSAIKLGTHCGNSADGQLTPKFGRLANEHAPLRETLVYQLLHAADIPTLLVRPARVRYVFTGEQSRPPLTRNAMLLEDDDEAQKRFGATDDIGEGEFESARAQLAPRDTARLAFAQAMIGNFDWCLRMFPGDIYRCDSRHPLWNILAFKRPGRDIVPVMYDFDLSGPVVGRHVWFDHPFDAAFVDPPSAIDVEVLAQVQRTRSLFDRTLLDETRAHFISVRPRVLEAIDRSAADEAGKGLARQYVASFYRAIENDDAFYRPIVVEDGHQAFVDADGTRPVCGASSLLPSGTPVSAPLDVRGTMRQVRILDALWQWTGDNHCGAIHTQPVWIDQRAIGTEYPR
jgi:hypothetical protein